MFAGDDAGPLQNAEVLAHALPTEAGAPGKLNDRPGATIG
jgi:hypothetical protein